MANVIEMNHITKKFGDFKANDDVVLHVEKGEIHALLGENGAGKSTLMSVLFGLYQPEEGTISIDGKEVKINNPNDANDLGIGMVHQHFKLVHNFTVLESIILGHETKKNGLLELESPRKKIIDLCKKYKFNLNPEDYIADLTVGAQQKVEILKMLYCDNHIMIFDEPTAVLTPQEIGELMKIMKQLTKEGKSIIFITHKLNEIKEVADKCSVLRKGKYIGTVDVEPTSKEEMSEMMVGRKVDFKVEKKPAEPKEAILEIKNMTMKSKRSNKNAVTDISIDVHAGEIVCIAGIDGNGQTEFVYGLSGIEPIDEGSIKLNGREISKDSIRHRNTNGISHIPEDRHKHGLVLDYTLEQNIVLQRYFEDEFQSKGFIKFDNIRKYADRLIEKFDIRSAHGAESKARGMSGGNQQKAIIARELDREHDLVIAVQPTRGLDVGAIEYIHKQLVAQRDAGKAVLLVSLELDEVMNLSDRILVMYEGEIVAETTAEECSIQQLGLYMAGTKKGE